MDVNFVIDPRSDVGLLNIPAASAAAVMATNARVSKLVAKHDCIHLKGFAQRIDFSDPTTEKQLRQLVQLISHCKEVVFDGDKFQLGSYVEIFRHLPATTRLIAYKKASGISYFQKSYGDPHAQGITEPEVRSAPDDLSWDELGEYALKDTGATVAVCFGGGETVRKEFERMGDRVTFVYFPVTRKDKDGGVEECALVDIPGTFDATADNAGQIEANE